MTNKAEPKPDLVWMDNQRWRLLQHWLSSDDDRIPFYPAWPELLLQLLQSELQGGKPVQNTQPVYDTAYANWLIWAETQTALPAPPKFSLSQYRSICNSCSSWCCSFLSVPLKQPTEFKDIDYIRYCLNFEGTQVAITETGWSLLVKTTCSHLRDNQCSIYQQPERPKLCRYYPEQDCYYRKTIAQPNNTQGYLRLAQSEFELMAGLFHFQDHGQLLPLPDIASIKAYVEQQLAASDYG
ncbi:YkgJ family cysteine cluster protein [Rheinheimera sp.]|jgi:Fe-S-cluster containining protein|uniref:YkgJ family cysteine cluster protein n=1 Tax=Rheinheimera sp. TaxID=1869214 RepID=UPI002606A07A|nr:YkgJ family cysteine cluster protein [Rheinheimera sp.]MCA1930479.1 YkgJ family cysteine cluster protein [Rheinheimera sp.]